jgi:tetratricopeptide (TPR) repeat protein
MKPRPFVTGTLIFAVLGLPAPSHAQPAAPSPKAASPADAAKARERFTQGVAFAKKNDWKNAYAAFLEAWKLKEHPQVALNLGRAELETGKYQDAIEHLRYCIDQSPAGDPDITLARDWLVQAEKKAAKLTVTVDIDGAPHPPR